MLTDDFMNRLFSRRPRERHSHTGKSVALKVSHTTPTFYIYQLHPSTNSL
jgi:hypothetical protein